MPLVASDIECGYGDGPVVKGVSFSLDHGHIVTVLGPNGVGKTTLFRAVLGFLPIDGGTIELDGKPLESLSRPEVARTIAYVPQKQNIPFAYTVEEAVLMGRAPHLKLLQQPGPEDRKIARDALDELGLGHLAKKPCTEVSGGELQMICIARALAQQPSYLVMDEPTASLDFGNQAKVLEQIMSLAQSGIGVLLTTHDPEQAFALESDVVLLQRGHRCRSGACEHVLTEEALSETYGVDVLIQKLSHKGREVTCCMALTHENAEPPGPDGGLGAQQQLATPQETRGRQRQP